MLVLLKHVGIYSAQMGGGGRSKGNAGPDAHTNVQGND